MQEHAWEKEYRKPKLVTGGDEPQTCVRDFVRFLRKVAKVNLDNLRVLDLGSGGGKNSIYLAEHGAIVTGMEIADTAIAKARARVRELGLPTASSPTFLKHSIGTLYPFTDQSFDLLLDITSSNSLDKSERGVYLKECHRVLATHGHFFVRALCKDGDENAKNLLKQSPGPEPETYYMPELDLFERVFSREDFIATYSPFFTILSLEKSTQYTRFNNQSYKRNFWLAYLKK